MEEVYKKCPKCLGNGKQEYVYFQVGTILEKLASLKKGNAIDPADTIQLWFHFDHWMDAML